jgi:hypothetical protein
VRVDAPPLLAAKAAWVLTTLLAACGARADVHVNPPAGAAQVGSCALAYAAQPVPGVPTLPLSAAALELFTERRPLPAGSFGVFDVGATKVTGAFPVAGDCEESPTFAVPFDLVASAFVLLAAWDELTSTKRDAHGRFPFAASIFATEPELDVGRPAVDAYLPIVRDLVGARLAELGRPPLPAAEWGPGERFALALTHDIDNLRGKLVRDSLAFGRRTATGARRLPLVGPRPGDGTPHREPYRTIVELLEREHRVGVSSTFFVLAGHSHPTDGGRPDIYQAHVPAVLRLLGAGEREIGLHGNHRDAHDPVALTDDRASLAARAQAAIDGVRYHYLKCLYHDTLPMLDEAGFTYDTSLAYAEREGWRCGFSHPFHPFDVARERPLGLVELPLALMDSTLQEAKYRGLAAPQARTAALAIAGRLRDGGGGSAVLWHQNRFHPATSLGYGDVYWELLEWSRANGAALLSAGELVQRWRARAGETEP